MKVIMMIIYSAESVRHDTDQWIKTVCFFNVNMAEDGVVPGAGWLRQVSNIRIICFLNVTGS